MKLSFSTKGWYNNTFDGFCDIASELKYEGIELHNIKNAVFTDKNGKIFDFSAAATIRRLHEKKLTVSCIDVIADPATDENACVAEIRETIDAASNLHIPYIRLRASEKNGEKAKAAVQAGL